MAGLQLAAEGCWVSGKSPLLGMAWFPISCHISIQKTLSHSVHFTLVSFSNATQTNFCLIAQKNKVHIGAQKVMG